MAIIHDSQLITRVCKNWDIIIDQAKSFSHKRLSKDGKPEEDISIKLAGSKINHPLDKIVYTRLVELARKIETADKDDAIYNFTKDVMELWKIVIEKSIMCLRFYDTREPFIELSDKHPIAYGIEELNGYFEKFTEFESLLYGGSKYYRDHVIHAFRTWLLGLDVLFNNNGVYLESIAVGDKTTTNILEKISIWSLISLTHDLGYPLEKAQDIIDATKKMMHYFVANPSLSMNLSFSGVQDNINDFILRLISSKMIGKKVCCNDLGQVIGSCTKGVNEDSNEKEKLKYVARLQPKYYFKMSKSLERSKHGILSSIILYKLLQYFLESDFSIDEDYYFDSEDARQFYIRREILRSIATHTCHDIYHLDMFSFSYLLIIVDDAQDWGRKRFSDLFFGSSVKYEPTTILVNISTGEDSTKKIHKTDIDENVKVEKDEKQLEYTLQNHFKQSQEYRVIFKDGLDTKNRNFNLRKKAKIVFISSAGNDEFDIEFNIYHDKNADFKLKLKKSSVNIAKYDKQWIEKVLSTKETKVKSSIQEEEEWMIWSVDTECTG